MFSKHVLKNNLEAKTINDSETRMIKHLFNLVKSTECIIKPIVNVQLTQQVRSNHCDWKLLFCHPNLSTNPKLIKIFKRHIGLFMEVCDECE